MLNKYTYYIDSFVYWIEVNWLYYMDVDFCHFSIDHTNIAAYNDHLFFNGTLIRKTS